MIARPAGLAHLGKCTRCTHWGHHDYCSSCGKDYCQQCFKGTCCGQTPIKSGVDVAIAMLTNIIRKEIT